MSHVLAVVVVMMLTDNCVSQLGGGFELALMVFNKYPPSDGFRPD
jgi:hypothetical protein